MGSLTSAAKDLATFSPFFTQAAPYVAATADLVSGAMSHSELKKQQAQELAQLQAKQAANMKDAQEQAALKRSELAAQNEAADHARKDALKRAVAKQRAQYGAQGISTLGGGSSEAVLLGLFDNAEADAADSNKLYQLDLASIDQNLGAQKRLNVIQRTQLKQRQKLERTASSYL